MHVDYAETMTMREARTRYFEVNGFGADGGYGDKWVDFKLGPIPFPFPNSPSRVEAVRYHDLHHVLTGYDTDIVGEFEIAAWEIAAGCKSFVAAWALNLGGMFGGLLRAPKRTFAAFVRGRRERSLYGEPLEAVLDTPVGELRRRQRSRGEGTEPADASDIALFVLATAAGAAIGSVMFTLFVPLVPIGLLAHHLRKRQVRARA